MRHKQQLLRKRLTAFSAHWYLAIICNLKSINQAYQRNEHDALPSRQASEGPAPNVSGHYRRTSPVPDNVEENEATSGADALPEQYSRMSIDGDQHEQIQEDEIAKTEPRPERRVHLREDATAQTASQRTVPKSEGLKQTGEAAPAAHKTEGNKEDDHDRNKWLRRKSKGGALRTYDPERWATL